MIDSNLKNARLVARVSTEIQNTIHKAASFSGATVTQFLIDAALEKAKIVINDVETISLSNEASSRMMELLNNPPEPNTFLKKAKDTYLKSIKNVNNSAVRKKPQKENV